MPQSPVKPVTAEESVGGAREFEYLISRMIGRSYTATLVKIDAVRGTGIGPVGFVDATDLIQQVTGSGEGIPNVPMLNLPYFRLQGGGNAVIIDPKQGDIGIAIFAYRDISSIKKTKAEGIPASARSYDVSDGIYIGGLLNGTPSQYVHFLESGIKIKSAAGVEIDCSTLSVTGSIVAGGDVSDSDGSMADIRSIYNGHGHAIASGSSAPGPTDVPNEQM